MPKTTKKTATKKVAKKAPVKKTATKSTFTPKPVMVDIPKPDIYCHCTKRKRNCILTCVFTGAFLLGFFTYHIFFCSGHHFMPKPHFEFVNGCLNTETIKCPKMLEKLPMIDADHDGCITKAELDASKPMKKHHRPAPVEEPAVVDAIAPVMED